MDEKTEAVRLYVELGATEAARQVGCSRDTIYEWLGQYPTAVGDEKEKERRAEQVLRREAKREAGRDAILDAWVTGAVTAALIASDPRQSKAYQLMSIGVGTLLDKYRLEMGEATSRTINEGADDIDRSVVQLVAEMARRGDPPDG